MDRVEIDETTVGMVGRERVPMGNMCRGTYTLADGSTADGWMCSLAIGGQVGVFVGVGSEVEIGGQRWAVVRIDKESGQLGSVTLEKR
jgi:hypothetical protein